MVSEVRAFGASAPQRTEKMRIATAVPGTVYPGVGSSLRTPKAKQMWMLKTLALTALMAAAHASNQSQCDDAAFLQPNISEPCPQDRRRPLSVVGRNRVFPPLPPDSHARHTDTCARCSADPRGIRPNVGRRAHAHQERRQGGARAWCAVDPCCFRQAVPDR